MPTFSAIQIRTIRLIGDNGGYNSWDAPSPHKLWTLAKANQIDRAVFNTTIKELESNEIIIYTDSKKGHKQIELTVKGITVYNVIDNSAGLLGSYYQVYLETFFCEDIQQDVTRIESFIEVWGGEFVHWLADTLYNCNALEKSLFHCFLASQTPIFNWLAHSLLGGSYNIVLRELRHILEGLFASYFIEIKHLDKSAEQKVEIFTKLESEEKLYGKRVFKDSSFDEWEKYYETYRQLSKYVHLSKDIIKKQVDRGHDDFYEPEFSKIEFQNCVDAWVVVAKAAASLANKILELYGSDERIEVDLFSFYEMQGM